MPQQNPKKSNLVPWVSHLRSDALTESFPTVLAAGQVRFYDGDVLRLQVTCVVRLVGRHRGDEHSQASGPHLALIEPTLEERFRLYREMVLTGAHLRRFRVLERPERVNRLSVGPIYRPES